MNNTTKDKLLEAAVRVLNMQPRASLADIAEAAGVKRVTLHRVIGTREELLRDVALRALEQMDEACYSAVKGKRKAFEQLKAIVGALVPYADSCHFLWKNPDVWDDPEIAREIKRHDQELCDLIDRAKAEGDILSFIPNSWIIASLDAVLYAAASTAKAGNIATNDASALAIQTLFGGITKKVKGTALAGA
ncbi:TetR/AcrR family transcriptional regulator [Pseudovibrio brasiliensis]|uniref:TetR/AcrR family transcriptional regulator n=1 Tax=Pseudovibrio brasiliensis TaxID=1898042 RepID=A0ABX8AW30_9HYPH|nr:TetR/AcrR family transcriptional regulator [Pseudovibrio brasiliensis]